MIVVPNLKIFEEVIEENGDKQKIVAMEELAELIQAISKDLRGYPNQDNIAEEMADVYIMLHQLEIMYQNGDIIRHKIYEKAKRLENNKGVL